MNREAVGTMCVKICGHKVRWQKPIKFFSLIRHHLCVLVVLGLFGIVPAYAEQSAERLSEIKPSSGSAMPCQPHKEMSGTTINQIAPDRTQRAAGSPSMSPAMALALALGVRNVSGPMQKSAAASEGGMVCKTTS